MPLPVRDSLSSMSCALREQNPFNATRHSEVSPGPLYHVHYEKRVPFGPSAPGLRTVFTIYPSALAHGTSAVERRRERGSCGTAPSHEANPTHPLVPRHQDCAHGTSVVYRYIYIYIYTYSPLPVRDSLSSLSSCRMHWQLLVSSKLQCQHMSPLPPI